MKTKIGMEIAHVIPDSGTSFKVKRSKVKVTRPLYSARPATVSMGTYSAWETTDCYVASARRRATGGGEGRGILCPHANSLFYLLTEPSKSRDIWVRVLFVFYK